MNAIAKDVFQKNKFACPRGNGALAFLDPLDDDLPSDEIVMTTRRGMIRMALVATEVASRFQREGVTHDAMAWMLAPRSLFGGAAAVDACVGREACLHGILLHGLSIGLDANPSDIEALVSDDLKVPEFSDVRDARSSADQLAGDPSLENVLPVRPADPDEPRLFTATVVASDGFEIVQAFHASLAVDEAEIAGRLYCRIGAASADAVIVEGFDATTPLASALVSQAIADTLSLVAADPGSPLAAGLDLNIEQRFLT